MNTSFLKITAAAASFIFGSLAAVAVPVNVPNASFETPGNPITSTSNDNLVQGWVFSTSNSDLFGTAALNLNFQGTGAADGSRYAFIDNSGKTQETITSASSLGVITPLTTYTLTVAVGNVKPSDALAYGSPGNVSFSLLANGVAFATQTVSKGTVPNATFEDFSLTYITPATGSIIGENLTIQLASQNSSGGDYDAAFDNVTLDAIPEPTSVALLAAGALLLFCVIRRRSSYIVPVAILAITASFAAINGCHAQAIKSLPLDDHTVYHLKVGTDKVTTLAFPQPITALEGSDITTDPKTRAKLLLSYHAGDRFFSVRALADPATADLNVIINRKVYVLELMTDKKPFQSVTFYPADEPPAQSAGQPNVGPSRLLGLLDKAKAYPLLADQYPEMVSQIDKAEPFTQTLYEGFHVVLTKVFRFDAEDALIFQVEFVNETDKPIYYIPQSLAVRVGSGVYWSALSDASGIITAGEKDPKTGKITPGHSDGYFVICGTPHGGRNHLSVQNAFNVLVFRQENS